MDARSLGCACSCGSASSSWRLSALVDGVTLEACIGETLAALEVAEARVQARDPGVIAALDRIADDEVGHALLADTAVAGVRRRGLDPLVEALRARS
jgi:hypothetical protein